MNFEQAKVLLVRVLHRFAGVMHDPRLAPALRDLKADVSFDELGFDSLAAMEVCMGVEDESGIALDLGDLVAHPSVNRLAELLVVRSAGRGISEPA